MSCSGANSLGNILVQSLLVNLTPVLLNGIDTFGILYSAKINSQVGPTFLTKGRKALQDAAEYPLLTPQFLTW